MDPEDLQDQTLKNVVAYGIPFLACLPMLNTSREQHPPGDVIAVTEPKHQSGDEVPTGRGHCATLVAYVGFPENPVQPLDINNAQTMPN
jgi:hypothetical protein